MGTQSDTVTHSAERTRTMNNKHTLEDWRKLAGTRQGLINKLDKKVQRLESELTALKASRQADAARLALCDQREAA